MSTPSLSLFFLLFALVLSRADDLVTRDGTVYHNYTVVSHDDGYITILHSTGGGLVRLSQLPDAMQKQYGYDPAKAAAAVRADDAAYQASRVEIEHEEEVQDQKHRKELADAAKKKADQAAGH